MPENKRDALAERLHDAVLQTLELSHVWLGHKLGLYAALQDLDEASPAELAQRAGIAERYAREWLEQQAVAGILDLTAASPAPAERRYRLPEAHAEVLLDPESLKQMIPTTLSAIGVVQALPQVLEAFKTGAGVPYDAYGIDPGNCIGDGNRAVFTHHLAARWLPHLTDLHTRMAPGFRVADLGCGTGWSSISIARGFPGVRVDGVDLDPESIAQAERNAAEAGVSDQVTFHCASADTLTGAYDLICAFECLHDMSDPVSVLRAARDRMAPKGAMFVAEERVAEEFTAPGDQNERFHYGWSALHCLPASMNQQPSAAIGTAIRPSTVRSLALTAGFATAEVLPIEDEQWLFYRFDP